MGSPFFWTSLRGYKCFSFSRTLFRSIIPESLQLCLFSTTSPDTPKRSQSRACIQRGLCSLDIAVEPSSRDPPAFGPSPPAGWLSHAQFRPAMVNTCTLAAIPSTDTVQLVINRRIICPGLLKIPTRGKNLARVVCPSPHLANPKREERAKCASGPRPAVAFNFASEESYTAIPALLLGTRRFFLLVTRHPSLITRGGLWLRLAAPFPFAPIPLCPSRGFVHKVLCWNVSVGLCRAIWFRDRIAGYHHIQGKPTYQQVGVSPEGGSPFSCGAMRGWYGAR